MIDNLTNRILWNNIYDQDAYRDPEKLRRLLYYHYNAIYKQVATQLFIWENLPEGIPDDFIENALFDTGAIMFANDQLIGQFVSAFTATGEIDMYNRPTAYTVANRSSLNGKEMKADDVVIIKNNVQMMPTFQLIQKNINELVEIHLTKLSNMT